METDLLGPPFERRTIDLGRDDEGPVVATLVRRRPCGPTRRAVLWVHGWSDYFFQTHVADFFAALGFDFYALDLRKCGRSLLPHQTANFCRSLADYVPELDEAARIIRAEDGHDRLLVAAHSTGALITALWAHRRRAARVVDAMFFNSPFFDLNLPALVKGPAGAAEWLGRHQPHRVLPKPSYPVYGHSLHSDHRGEWSYDLAWKPIGGFPVRYGWLAAIRAGQRRLHAGLSIEVPILVCCSTRSYRSRFWHEQARRTDTVLDVNDMLRWAPFLGRHVTTVRIDGGMHDLTLSAAPVREVLFSEIARWTAAYAAGVPGGPAPAAVRPRDARAGGHPSTGHPAAPDSTEHRWPRPDSTGHRSPEPDPTRPDPPAPGSTGSDPPPAGAPPSAAPAAPTGPG